MKAKRIKKLRAKLKYYFVSETVHLFGSWDSDLNKMCGGIKKIRVLAISPEDAVFRYLKRKHVFIEDICEVQSDWAKYRVILEKPLLSNIYTYWN